MGVLFGLIALLLGFVLACAVAGVYLVALVLTSIWWCLYWIGRALWCFYTY